MKPDVKSTSYKRGKSDARLGKNYVDGNPFTPGTSFAENWKAGFKAQKEHAAKMKKVLKGKGGKWI